MTTSSGDSFTQRALELLDVEGKMAAVQQAEEALEALQTLRRRLAESERDYGRAYAEMIRAGWPEADLSKMGFEKPERRPRGRPRGSGRKTTARASGETPAPRDDAAASTNEAPAYPFNTS